MQFLARFHIVRLARGLMNHKWTLAVVYLGLVTIGALVYAWAEAKTVWDSVWWAFVTILTIGYGDMFPVTIAGRIDAVIVAHLGIMFVIPIIIGLIIESVLGDVDRFSDAEQKLIMAQLKTAHVSSDNVRENQRMAIANQEVLARMLIKFGVSQNVSLAGFMDELQAFKECDQLSALNQEVDRLNQVVVTESRA